MSNPVAARLSEIRQSLQVEGDVRLAICRLLELEEWLEQPSRDADSRIVRDTFGYVSGGLP